MIHTLDLKFQGYPASIAAFLIETSEGPILIETGPHSTLSALEKEIVRVGFQLKEIQHVFLSHIHLDHAGAAWVLAQTGATIYLHPFGEAHLAHPEKLMASAKQIYQDQMDVLWGQMKPIPEAQLKPVTHLQAIRIGDTLIRALHTPGHAKHHIAWEIGDTIFTCDVAGVKIKDGPVVPPCPPPDINLEDWIESINLIIDRKPIAIYLTHYGRIEAIEDHMSQLKSVMHDWADWIKNYWDKGWTAEQLTPMFSKYTTEQLLTMGVDELGVKQYEAANPSWMSVAGLIRYWHKKSQ